MAMRRLRLRTLLIILVLVTTVPIALFAAYTLVDSFAVFVVLAAAIQAFERLASNARKLIALSLAGQGERVALFERVPLGRVARKAATSPSTTSACCSKSLRQNVEVSEATKLIDWVNG